MTDSVLRTAMVASAQEVFSSMITPLEQRPPSDGEALRPRSNVVAQVALSGALSGIVAIYSTRVGAAEIAAGLLGVPANSAAEGAVDALGEVANMIAGALRTRLLQFGPAVDMSMPSVEPGSALFTQCTGEVKRLLCAFAMDEHDYFMELILTGA